MFLDAIIDICIDLVTLITNGFVFANLLFGTFSIIERGVLLIN